MAVSGDLTIENGGHGNVKLHPYIITLVRWCVSCLWSTATVLLHRLMVTPLQPITGPKPPTKAKPPKRSAGTDHLHPEPTVECQILHQPHTHTMDVIFVHGLYGSLGNTWRQGDWRQKYKSDPQIVPLRNHSTPSCVCHENSYKNLIYNGNKCNDDMNDTDMSMTKINEKLSKKIIPSENELITEQFYNNTLLDQVHNDNYETQAKFVTDLYKKENCDKVCDENVNRNICKCSSDDYICKCNDDGNKCDHNKDNENKCDFTDLNEFNECICYNNEKKCEVGCGCLCNECYSTCWPRDWIKVDFPGARVISINYTSDPYLWRPLWIKENKRLNLYQRAEQMIDQLLAMGVGDRPIIWVGHSKGGLFIKQIFCEGYEAHEKINQKPEKTNTPNTATNHINEESNKTNSGFTAESIDTIIGHFSHNNENNTNIPTDNDCNGNTDYMGNNDYVANDKSVRNDTKLFKNIFEQNKNTTRDSANFINEFDNENICNLTEINEKKDLQNGAQSCRASLWRQSRGFMFYSVPHRGSPLADIKTPVTARSVDLLEIAKECPLVVSLQSRWERAARAAGRVLVRSFVESCRTLMSVLWLRIVSEHSADAGVGTLSGISVDHREICKPSSRSCLLYTELTDLIHNALKCKCQ